MVIPPHVAELVRLALEEDLGRGDLTAQAVPAQARARARLIAKGECVAANLFVAELVVREAGAEAQVQFAAQDGQLLARGAPVLTITGNARDILSIERTMLNFLQRSFGVATLSRRFAAAVEGHPVRLTDTRKTLPGFRFLDKSAVRAGGLYNHRFGLDGGILVKENHIRAAGGIRAAVETLRMGVPHGLKIQVEVTSRSEAFEAIEAGAEALLLDNFSPRDIPVKEIRAHAPQVLLEASGGVGLGNVAEFAAAGVDLISIGALTHSVPAADLSLLFELEA
ncbi:MAG: carboxylating nicotinate-nucleotide diphosphorylase [Bdellovibrionales bacterium]|nr:carboxylating nicotinate-nucleotide diphosphorylase [Bdellovibrionales bacterium]